jgi:small-conductance mechanosensitive channel
MRVATAVLAGMLLVVQSTTSRAQEPAPPTGPSPEAEIPTAPVRIDNRELFRVRGTSSFPAAARAATIEARILEVARNSAIAPGALVVAPIPLGLSIRAGDVLVAAMVPADAALEAVPLNVLAEVHRQRIQQAISEYRAARDPRQLMRGVGLSLLMTLAMVLLALAIGFVFRRIVAALERRVRARIEAMPLGPFHVVQGKQMWEALEATVRAARWLIILLLGYFWLQSVLLQFPWTRVLGERLVGLLTNPLVTIGTGFVDFVPNLLFLIVLAFVTRYGLRLIGVYFAAVGRGTVTLGTFEPEWATPSYKIVRTLVIGLALVMAYPYLPGAGTEALQGLSVFAGLLFSLGAAGAVGGVIAGYLNTFGRVFRVGDVIKVGETLGEVTQVGLLTTRVRTPTNEQVTIPNASLLTTSVVNYSALAASHGLILHTEVGIGYEVPWRQVHAMLEEAARRTQGVLGTPAPFVLQRRLGDFSVVYRLSVYVGKAQGMLRTYSEMHQHILDVFNEHDVQIMTPAYEQDPEVAKTVPPDKWFAPPAKPPADAG